jgi:hypothetical protein
VNSAGYKKQIFLGLAMFAVGFSSAAAVGYHKLKQKPPSVDAKSEVLGETTSPSSPPHEEGTAPGPGEVKAPAPVPASMPPSPQPVPLPQASAPALPKPKPKIDYCKQYGETLAKTQDGIELKFQSDSAAAKNIYDSEQAAVASTLSDLARQRNQTVNDYLTAIAVATSKYNNSQKAASDYQTYETEQGAALALHNHAISEITAKEGAANTQKADSQSKYEASLKTFLDTKNQALSEAQAKYRVQIAGLVCS